MQNNLLDSSVISYDSDDKDLSIDKQPKEAEFLQKIQELENKLKLL